MGPLRSIGGQVGGKKHLGSALVEHHAALYTAAQVFLTPPAKMTVIEIEDAEVFERCAHHLEVYVHAPFALSLFPPLVRHGKQVRQLRQLAQRAAALSCRALVLHAGSSGVYGDRAYEAAEQMLHDLPLPVYIENAPTGEFADLIAFDELLGRLQRRGINVGLCLDTAYTWASGEPLEDESMLQRIQPPQLLHLNNTAAEFGSAKPSPHKPLFHGEIPFEEFERWLKRYPRVPVILERESPVQVAVDRAAVIAVDCHMPEVLEAMKKDPVMGVLK